MFFFFALIVLLSLSFFFNDTSTTEIYTLSLHDALPIYLIVHANVGGEIRATRVRTELDRGRGVSPQALRITKPPQGERSEEHTSELQSLTNLVCRLLLEKKKKIKKKK